MTELREKIERWCAEESRRATVVRDDAGGLECAVSAPGEAPPISVRSAPERPGRLTIASSFEFAVPAELAIASDAADRLAMIAETLALSRSALVECRPAWGEGRASVEVVVTVFEDGLSKQSFLTALDEVTKAGVLIGRELESASLAAGVLAEVQGIIAQTGAIASAMTAEPAPDAPVVVEQEAQPEVSVAVEQPEPEPEATVVAFEQAESTENVFCPNCGYQSRADARFCRSCGGRLRDA